MCVSDFEKKMGASGALLHIGLLGLYGYVSFVMQVGNKHNPHAKEYKSIEILGKYSARYLTNWTFVSWFTNEPYDDALYVFLRK